MRDRLVSVLEAAGVDVSVFPRVDACPRISNVVLDFAFDERVADGVRVCSGRRDSILLTTLDGLTVGVARSAVGADLDVEMRVVVDDVLGGMIVRETRLLLPLEPLLATVEESPDCAGGGVEVGWDCVLRGVIPTVGLLLTFEEDRGCVRRETTLTVRFTGREEVTPVRDDLLAAEADGVCVRDTAGPLV